MNLDELLDQAVEMWREMSEPEVETSELADEHVAEVDAQAPPEQVDEAPADDESPEEPELPEEQDVGVSEEPQTFPEQEAQEFPDDQDFAEYESSQVSQDEPPEESPESPESDDGLPDEPETIRPEEEPLDEPESPSGGQEELPPSPELPTQEEAPVPTDADVDKGDSSLPPEPKLQRSADEMPPELDALGESRDATLTTDRFPEGGDDANLPMKGAEQTDFPARSLDRRIDDEGGDTSGWEASISQTIQQRMSETQEVVNAHLDDELSRSIYTLDILGSD